MILKILCAKCNETLYAHEYNKGKWLLSCRTCEFNIITFIEEGTND
jgi:hypothetical protein